MPASLTHELERMIARQSGVTVSIAARRTEPSQEILINADQPYHPASTVKVCLMMEIFHQRHQGLLSLNEPVRVLNAFPSVVDGSLYSLDPADDSEKALYDAAGGSVTIRELVVRMITVSSNLATNLLLTRVSPKQTSEFMIGLGAPELRLTRGMEDKAAHRLGLNNAGTARGFLTILDRLVARQVVSPPDSDEMIDILTRQQLNEMIPARLPAGTPVAHKTGWIDEYYHDVGIVYPRQSAPFVLAIMTRGFPEKEPGKAHAFVSTLARMVYDRWC